MRESIISKKAFADLVSVFFHLKEFKKEIKSITSPQPYNSVT